jgi:drug/metabolite transporter (DMT)-like permease
MSPRHRAVLPWIALFVIYVVWGSTYMAIRVVVREMPPVSAAALRFSIAGLLMGLIALVADRGHPRPTWRQVFAYSVVGVLLLSVGNALVMWSEKRIPSGIAALIVATVPLWLTVIDGVRPGGRPWTARLWTGTLIGLVGVALVARPEGGLGAGHWPAILALQGATISWVVGSLHAQSIRPRLPVASASAIEMLAASAVLFVASRVVGEDAGLVWSASRDAWLGVAYLVTFGSIVGFTAFAYCLNELPASVVGTYAYVNPVVAVALGALFLGERLTPGLLAGGVLILVAVVLTTRGQREASRPPVNAPEDVVPVAPRLVAEGCDQVR